MRSHGFLASLVALLLSGGVLSGSLLTTRVRADAPAYYIVVQRDGGSTMAVQIDSSSTVVVQSGSSTLQVDCGRYASADDATTVAAGRYAGQSWTVVNAVDAWHALLQASGQDAAGLDGLSLSDAAVCTP